LALVVCKLRVGKCRARSPQLSFADARRAGFGFFNMGANVVIVTGAAVVVAFQRFERSEFAGAATRFTRQDVDCGRRFANLRRGRVTIAVAGILPVAMIVVVQIFKNITDIEEGVAIETDVHESGLHTGKDAGDFTFVDAADEGEFFFALDIDLD
jgi:hypothetical protein